MRNRLLALFYGLALLLCGCALALAQPAHPINAKSGIKWPANCAGSLTTYNIVTDSCQVNGTAANPAGTSGQGQMNQGGAFAGYNFGLKWAQLLQTGGGNNGIVNGIGVGNTGFADPSYPSTEAYSYENMIPNVPANYHLLDQRGGLQNDFFHNWLQSNWEDQAAKGHTCLYDGVPASNPNFSFSTTCVSDWYVDSQPGWSFGNAPWGTQGWKVPIGHRFTTLNYGSGIHEISAFLTYTYGVGDNVPNYFYVNGEGGWTGYSDEGTKGVASLVQEDHWKFVGTCSTGCTAGSTSLKLTNTTLAANGKCTPNTIGGDCALGTGRYMIDTTAGGTSTTVTAIGSGLGSASAVTVAATVPVSNAWGTQAGNCGPSSQTDNITVPPFSKSYSCTIAVTSGTFDNSHVLCFESQFHECAIPTSVTAPSGGNQTLTINLRKPHAGGGRVYQGGMAGTGIEFTSLNQTVNGVVLRYLIDVLGSTDSHTLQAIHYFQGTPTNLSGTILTSLFLNGTWNAGTLSNSGTTVSGVSTGGGSYGQPYYYNNGSWTFSGASDPVFNTACTNFAWTDSTHFTCTIAGLTGSHTAATATVTLGTNGIVIWPMAEVIDVQNESTTPPVVDGSVRLEPNVIQTGSGHTMEETHHAASHFQGQTNYGAVYNPYNIGSALTLNWSGGAFSGGGQSAASNAMLNLQNANPDSMYQGGGGILNSPNLINAVGPFGWALDLNEGASLPNNGGVFNQFFTAAQLADPNYFEYLFKLNGNSGSSTMQFFPKTNTTWFLNSGPVVFGPSSTTFTFQGATSLPAGSTINSKAPTGSGAALPTGPSSTTAGDIVTYSDTAGTQQDSGVKLIANVQITTGTTTVNANSCTANTATTMTGLTTTSAIFPPTPTSSTVAVTGWGSSGGLSFAYYVTANTFNWSVCNATAVNITPGGSVTWNVGAR